MQPTLLAYLYILMPVQVEPGYKIRSIVYNKKIGLNFSGKQLFCLNISDVSILAIEHDIISL